METTGADGDALEAPLLSPGLEARVHRREGESVVRADRPAIEIERFPTRTWRDFLGNLIRSRKRTTNH